MFLLLAFFTKAQKVTEIYFHPYTDSLKKGFFNYINVDGKTTSGNWLPLTAKEIHFTLLTDSLNARAVYMEGNDLFIDSSYTADSIRIKAELISNPALTKEFTIYIQKRGFDPLKSEEEILSEMQKRDNRAAENYK